MNKKFTHFNQDGEAHMVSIKDKEDTNRIAIASGSITMSVETIKMIKMGSHKKGDVINVARIAAIMAVKNTPSIIPLCHNINVTSVDIDFEIQESACEVNCIAKIETFGKSLNFHRFSFDFSSFFVFAGFPWRGKGQTLLSKQSIC